MITRRQSVFGALMHTLCVIGMLALLVPTMAISSSAQDIRFFRIATGTTGGTYFPIGGIIANAISNPPGSRPCDLGGSCGVPGLIAVAQTTSGSIENITLLENGAVEAGLAQADILYWASTASGIWEGQPPTTGARAVAVLYVEETHLVTLEGADIDTPADLVGHHVSIGPEQSGTAVNAEAIMGAFGVGLDDVTVARLGPGPSVDAVVAGEIDAFFMVGGQPIVAIADATRRARLKLIPISGDPANALTASSRFMVATDIPDDAYPDVEGVPTLGVGATLVVSDRLDDDLVYGLTRALWADSTRQLLAAGHPRGASIALPRTLDGLPITLHPGAARYYRDVGLLTPSMDTP